MNNNEDNILNYIIDFVRDILKHWLFLLISCIITLSTAVVYLKFAAKSYKVNASIVLNIERSNAYGSNSDDMLRVNELIDKEKNLQNEVYFLKSTPLINSVVEEMDLDVSYFLQEDKIPKEAEFSMKDLYTGTPFMVITNKEHYQPVDVYIYVRILDEERFSISAYDGKSRIVNFRDQTTAFESTAFSLNGIYKFGEEISNPFTSFRILLNSNYKSELFLGKDLFFKFNTNYSLTKQFQGSLSVEASDLEATIVKMSLNSFHPQKGIDFLNKLIIKYIENNLEDKNFLAIKTIEHLDYQLSDISESLGSSEQELQNIRRNSSVMNIDEKAANIYQQLQASEEQKDEIQKRLSYLNQMNVYFAENRDSSGFLAPSAIGLDDPLLNSLIQELTTLTSERQQIINNNQLRNPRLKTLDISINNLKEVILENLQYSINAANSELKEENRKIWGLNSEFSSLPLTQRRLLGIERKFNLSENVYMSLLEQRIQAQIIKASTLSDCKVIEPPQFVSIHSPKNMIILILAIFIGFLIPITYVLGKKLFTNKVLDKEELRRLTSLNQIGTIPQLTKNAINVVAEQPNSVAAEAIHTVRSNIIYYLLGKMNQVIMVTSTMEGEGKSFSALNIASSLALTNNKTCLLEFDLRRPSELYSKLGIRGLVGVSSYLINKASLDEITINSDVDNLDIILAGQIPPNPIELISSKKTTELFEELRKRYDYIIVDTPPYGVLTDSFVLMKFADIKIYVTRLGRVKKRILLSSLEDIEAKKIDNIQILINGDTMKDASYGKYYTTPSKRGLFRKPQGGRQVRK